MNILSPLLISTPFDSVGIVPVTPTGPRPDADETVFVLVSTVPNPDETVFVLE